MFICLTGIYRVLKISQRENLLMIFLLNVSRTEYYVNTEMISPRIPGRKPTMKIYVVLPSKRAV